MSEYNQTNGVLVSCPVLLADEPALAGLQSSALGFHKQTMMKDKRPPYRQPGYSTLDKVMIGISVVGVVFVLLVHIALKIVNIIEFFFS